MTNNNWQDTPVETMVSMTIEDERNPTELPFYLRGARATRDAPSTSAYLKTVLPLKYQRMLGFESHSQHAPGMKVAFIFPGVSVYRT